MEGFGLRQGGWFFERTVWLRLGVDDWLYTRRRTGWPLMNADEHGSALGCVLFLALALRNGLATEDQRRSPRTCRVVLRGERCFAGWECQHDGRYERTAWGVKRKSAALNQYFELKASMCQW